MMKSAIALSLVLFAACGKKDENKSGSDTKGKEPSSAVKDGDKKDPPKAEPPKAEPPKPAKEADMSKMTVTAPKGWEGEYNKALQDWTYEKYTPGKDGTNEPNRLYVSTMPDDVPVELDAYAAKLPEQNFQDIGFHYSKIDKKEKVGDGWLITGVVEADKPDKDDKPEMGLVMMRDIDGARIRCRSGTLKSEDTRKEAIELCKSIKLGK